MFNAISEQTISAMRTASGKAPPAKGIAAPRLNATAEAGAMVVIDWNKTPGSPMALRRKVDRSGGDEDEDSTDIPLLLLYPTELVEKASHIPTDYVRLRVTRYQKQ